MLCEPLCKVSSSAAQFEDKITRFQLWCEFPLKQANRVFQKRPSPIGLVERRQRIEDVRRSVHLVSKHPGFQSSQGMGSPMSFTSCAASACAICSIMLTVPVSA